MAENPGAVIEPAAQERATGDSWAPVRTPRPDPRSRARYHDFANAICLISAPSISPKIRHALRHIEKNYEQRVTLQRVAAAIGCHPTHLCQKFREELGSSFYTFVIRVRLKAAIRLLVYSDDPIKQVAYQVGFRSPETLAKVFARWIHCSPTVFRDRYRYR